MNEKLKKVWDLALQVTFLVFMSGEHKHYKIRYLQVSARLHKHLVSRSCGVIRTNI